MFGEKYTNQARRSTVSTMDWGIIISWLVLVFVGWVNIYASVHGDDPSSIFDFSCRSGKQFIWILTAVGLACTILFAVPPNAYDTLAPLFYVVSAVLLVAVIFLGGEINGSKSWFVLGPVSFQPAEISKIATALLLASTMSRPGYRMRGKAFLLTVAIILIPMLIIVGEKETGSALVYVGFIFMLYREGLSGWLIALGGLAILLFILTIIASPFVGVLIPLALVSLFDAVQGGNPKWWFIIAIPLIVVLCLLPDSVQLTSACIIAIVYGIFSIWRAYRGFHQNFRWLTLLVLICSIALVFSADFLFNDVLKDYQRSRIEVLLGMKEDLAGAGYNVHQSKIAIGSGGFTGKGFCQGTQTAYGYVPEQSTDFIFCTVGEEWGFCGCLFLIAIYVFLLYRIVQDAEHSREAFTRIYGYCVCGIIFMHMFINMGMTLGLMPVIGIPLPFVSYGGSSMWSFTVMLFIFVALDRNERKYF